MSGIIINDAKGRRHIHPESTGKITVAGMEVYFDAKRSRDVCLYEKGCCFYGWIFPDCEVVMSRTTLQIFQGRSIATVVCA